LIEDLLMRDVIAGKIEWDCRNVGFVMWILVTSLRRRGCELFTRCGNGISPVTSAEK